MQLNKIDTADTDISSNASEKSTDIAIIGMAGRFPGARNIDEFWANLISGEESIRRLTDEELLRAGVSRRDIEDPDYVKACPVLDDIDKFDAAFFKLSPRDASVMDPAHRFFLEVAWEALENSGNTGLNEEGRVGVFASSGQSLYLMNNVRTHREIMESMGEFLVRHTSNDMNFLATRASYDLDLRGPSINVQTACSSALVAAHLARQSLLAGECDMALIGGSTINNPMGHGYHYKEGEILSPDGHCRPFDHRSAGTVFGSGTACLVLKRLDDALDNGDTVHALIKGSAVNNDGSMKVSFLAPGVDGQVGAVESALKTAQVNARSISYIEAHGTGTSVGDPIELTALEQAFSAQTKDKQFCGIGSVKSNIGHLGEAAAAASLIKVVLALKHRMLPPSLGYERPNPRFAIEDSPFYVNAALKKWESSEPLRAGINALGAGGTNCHLILEEPPALLPGEGGRDRQLIVLSAKSKTALEQMSNNLAVHLEKNPEADLADIAYTLAMGRRALSHRRVVVASDHAEAIGLLRGENPTRVGTTAADSSDPDVVYTFPGGGAQYSRMCFDLYETEPVYRSALDECFDIIDRELDKGLRGLLFSAENEADASTEKLQQPSFALPTLFAVEYALARLFESYGVRPAAYIGHSMGEYVAACLAGVFSLRDGLRLVHLRGRLFESTQKGNMIGVSLSEQETRSLMPLGLSIAAVNAPELCVASGPSQLIENFSQILTGKEIDWTPIHIDVAAHSSLLDPILDEFRKFCRSIDFHPPLIPIASNLTGRWLSAAEATDPEYWVKHLRNTVRFTDCVETVLEGGNRVFLEIGPGRTLTTLVGAQKTKARHSVNSVRHPKEAANDVDYALLTLGKVWAAGAHIDWTALYDDQIRNRVPLPTYPFETQSYWVEPGKTQAAAAPVEVTLNRYNDVADWFYRPQWRREDLLTSPAENTPPRTLVFEDSCGFGARVSQHLGKAGCEVLSVRSGAAYSRDGANSFVIQAGSPDDYASLISVLKVENRLPQNIVHGWSLTGAVLEESAAGIDNVQAALDLQSHGFYSLLALAQALGSQDVTEPLNLVVLTDHVQRVAGEDDLIPAKATVLGACRVLPREFPNLRARVIDLALPPVASWQHNRLVANVSAELAATDAAQTADTVAWRGGERWVLDYARVHLDAPSIPLQQLRRHGVYLITGGLGGVGLAMAEHLAARFQAKLVLLGRSALPARAQWDELLATPDTPADVAHRIRQLRALEAHGAEVMLATVDVTNLAQMTAVVRQACDRFGTVHGVLHTAGVIDDGVIQLKQAAAAAAVLAPKLQGTLVLEAALKGVALDFMLLFSSTSSFLGLAGQVDYAAANAFLDAYAHARCARDGGFTVAVNWSAWAEAGMAAKMGRQLGIANATEPDFNDGVAISHPLVDRCLRDSSNERVYATRLSINSHWLLDEHRVRGGEALVPGTGYLDLVRAAFLNGGAPRPVTLSDVIFLAPFAVRSGQTRELRVVFNRSGSSWRFAVRSRSGSGWADHVRGQVAELAAPAPISEAPTVVASRCTQRSLVFQGGEPSVHMQFGPRWGNVRGIDYGMGEALVSLQLPAVFESDLHTFALHPALLDMATGGAQALVPGFDEREDFFVPASYGTVRVFAPLVPQLFSHVRYRDDNEPGKELASYDVTLTDAEGRVLVVVNEFTMIRLRNKALLAVAAEPEIASAPTSVRPHAIANRVLELGLREGIRNHEGAEVLTRVLATGAAPQVVVSPLNLGAIFATLRDPPTTSAAPAVESVCARDVSALETALQSHDAVSEAAASANGDRVVAYVVYDPEHTITVSELRRHVRAKVPEDLVPQTFVELDALPRGVDGTLDRAALPSPFAEEHAAISPRTPMEHAIGELWQELLGATAVGVHDNFFDIGGHSLLSVRFISRLNKKVGVRLLHEHVAVNTLEQLAAKCDQMAAQASVQ